MRALEEIFKRCDSKADDKLDYEEFLEYFRAVPDTVQQVRVSETV